jgi:hypothetical protein
MRELTRSAAVVAGVILLGASGISLVERQQAASEDPYDAVVLVLATAADNQSHWERKSQHRNRHAQDRSARDRSARHWSGDRSTPEVGVDATAREASTGSQTAVQSPVRAGSDVVLRSLPGIESGRASCS